MYKRIGVAITLMLVVCVLTACGGPESTYKSAQDLLSKGKYSEAAAKFESIGSFEDASTLAIYCKACALCESGNFETGIAALENLGEYKDSPMRITYYTARSWDDNSVGTTEFEWMEQAKSIYNKNPLYLDSMNRMTALDERIAKAKEDLYNAAVKDGENGKYSVALDAFSRLKSINYKDSKNRYTYYGIRRDEDALASSNNQDAMIDVAERYTELGVYLDCENRATALIAKADAVVTDKYAQIVAFIDEGKYQEADDALAAFGTYGNEQILANYYALAEKCLAEGLWDTASVAFTEAGTYSDAEQGVIYCSYRKTEDELVDSTDQDKVIELANKYTELGAYKDCADRASALVSKADGIVSARYAEVTALVEKNELKKAQNSLKAFGTYGNKKLPEYYYGIAEKYFASEQWDEAYYTFRTAGNYKDANKKANDCLAKVREFAAGKVVAVGDRSVGLKSNGTVVAIGEHDDAACDVSSWRNITVVISDQDFIVGLKADGTVVSTDRKRIGAIWKNSNVNNWKNIVAINTGYSHIVGLKSNGTVVADWCRDDYESTCRTWKDIVAISSGSFHTVGLKSDGTVVAAGYDDGQCDVYGWRNIVAVFADHYATVGLKADGTVVAAVDKAANHYNWDQSDVSDWKDIVSVSIGYEHVVGLKSDGTVVAAGSNEDGKCAVSGWKDIVAVLAGDNYTIGLKADGTLVSTGLFFYKKELSLWKDIVALSHDGNSHVIGIKIDGTVLEEGEGIFVYGDVSNWDLFD